MIQRRLHLAGSALVCLAWILSSVSASAAKNLNLSISADGDPERCSDLKVRSSGQVAQSDESFTLGRNEAPVLEIDDAAGRGAIRVRAWDRAQYQVQVCKIAAAEDRGGAEQLLRSIGVSRSAGRFSTSGPSGENNWQIYLIVHAPKDGNLDLQTKNGPISVREMVGTVKVRATNGPIALNDCGGQVDATTTNGPISFSGQGGEVRLNAQNGPISVRLSDDVWNGSRLEAKASNGPVSLAIPETFRSGVRVETSHGPVSCGAAPCKNAWRDEDRRTMQFNGSQDTIRISTENGPVSVNSGRRGRAI